MATAGLFQLALPEDMEPKESANIKIASKASIAVYACVPAYYTHQRHTFRISHP
jgi:hypothetical protein